MEGSTNEKLSTCTDEIIRSFDDLPVLVRLEFVGNVICAKAKDQTDPLHDPTLSVAWEVLYETIRVLKTVKGISELKFAKPVL